MKRRYFVLRQSRLWILKKICGDMESTVPRPIQQKLVLARARNGGPELALRDIKNAELIEKFELVKAAQAS